MESVELNSGKPNPAFWNGKRVFLTGHTGFKGGWMSLWLHNMGAKVYGYALEPATEPNLFKAAAVADCCEISTFGDIQDPAHLKAAVLESQPDVIIHMAAQAIVQEGYADPVGTFDTNVMGTIHLMQATRELPTETICLVITSDKCYQNPADGRPLKEPDPLGGDDPYSASKGACEVAVATWMKSFFASPETPTLATARAGNVIGGGDWSPNRLLCDAARMFSSNSPLELRNPKFTRPWQHVLEPLSGYLVLIERLAANKALDRHFNFGPHVTDAVSVEHVAKLASQAWGDGAFYTCGTNPQSWKESELLVLDIQKAIHELGWNPTLDLATAVTWTMDWYKHFHANSDARSLCLKQIADYQSQVSQD